MVGVSADDGPSKTGTAGKRGYARGKNALKKANEATMAPTLFQNYSSTVQKKLFCQRITHTAP
jgi:hypothetical protein